jgi:hypothetical protein
MESVFQGTGMNDDQVDEAVNRWKGLLNDVQAFRTAAFEGELFDPFSGIDFSGASNDLIGLERAFFGAAAQSRGMGEDVDTMNHFLGQTQILIKRLNKDQKGQFMRQLYDGVKKVQDRINNLANTPMLDPMRKQLEQQRDRLVSIMNAINKSLGLKQGKTGTTSFFNYFFGNAEKAKDKANDIDDAVQGIRDSGCHG